MISTRFMPAVFVLIALALVPTLIHSYAGALATDGRSTGDVPFLLAGFSSTQSDRNSTWGKRRFDSDDWMERTYLKGSQEARLTVVRSYDAKSLYHHPELAIAYGTSFEAVDTVRLKDRPDMPVHVLSPAPGVQARAFYVLHYDDGFIDNAIAFQLRNAGELLFERRKPMTLFFVFVPDAPADAKLEDLPAVSLLVAATDSFLGSQPRGATASR